jgi:hypothetical protein
MLCMEIITLCCEIHMKHVNALCVQNVGYNFRMLNLVVRK